MCRQLDWARTPLGEPSGWPQALRIAVRTALDSPFPMNLWCGAELVLIYNDAYRDVMGNKHPRGLGARGADVWAEIWHEIRPMFEGIRAGGPAVYAEDAPFIVLRDDGSPTDEVNAWFTFALSAVRDEEGAVVAFLNVVSETTGRMRAESAREQALAKAEQAEARLRDVFAQAPSFLAVLRGDDHVFEYVNDAYYQLVGHRELLNLPLFDALPEVRGQGFEELLDTVIETAVPYIGREVPVMVQRTPDSELEQRFVDLVYYPIHDPVSGEAGVVAHGSDVTEHVQARQEAQRARAEAEQANQAKSQFLANMSHEIRTPINAVVGYTDLLDTKIAGPLTERQQEFVERIRSSSRHLMTLVNDVLDLAKIEAGEMRIEREPAAAREVVATAMQMVAAEADARRLTLREEWHCESDTRFIGDGDRVRQIVLNLLANALKFTPAEGSVTLRCRMTGDAPLDAMLTPGSTWVVLDVEDTGTGIAHDQQARIFEAFVQADAGHTRQVGGTGLGLTISRRLARLMGGDLTLRSTPGAGSCFSLWLPTTDAVPGAADRAPAEDSAYLAIGQMVVEAAEILEDELVWRLLESHPEGDRILLADHTAPFIAAVGRAITAHERAGESLQEDSVEVRTVIAERHGRQRRRLGWTRAHIEYEYQLLRGLLDDYVRREAPRRTHADIELPVALMQRVLATAQASSIAAYEQARMEAR